jgi:hypothetical protein
MTRPVADRLKHLFDRDGSISNSLLNSAPIKLQSNNKNATAGNQAEPGIE